MNDIQKFEERSVAKTEPQGMTLVEMAIQKKYDPEFISKMMDLQERNDIKIARQAYHRAMTEFKKNPPDIEKDRHVKYKTSKGVTEYTHASLANVTKKINAALSEHGLSAGWKTDQSNGDITVTCTITHEIGHSESTSLTAKPDLSGSKNPIQAMGSTISYLERYTVLALTGLATSDMDTDAVVEMKYINEKQLSTIVDMINEKEVDEEKFLKYMGVSTLDKISADAFGKAITALKKKKKPRQPGEEG